MPLPKELLPEMLGAADETVELMKPLLPTAEKILPYLKRIDAARWYSNFGPLEREFKQRAGEYFGLDAESVVNASSATAGLISVLNVINRPKHSLCLMPAWTFVATPAAAIAAEMTPYFLDVDEKTWALDPAQVKAAIKSIKGVVGAIVAVSPFGRPLDLKAWEKLSHETSIPVVIDAAAGWDGFRNAEFGNVPVVFSLHATKVFGAGEAGIVVSRDRGLLRHVQEQTNFGFYTRQIATPGINSKMSEYSAAVCLAALDNWPQRRREWETLIDKYLDALMPLAKRHNLEIWLSRDHVTSTCNVRLPEPKGDAVISQLQRRGIKARRWWDNGCHHQPAYAHFPRTELVATNAIAASMVSLPFYVDIPDAHIAYIATHLDNILGA